MIRKQTSNWTRNITEAEQMDSLLKAHQELMRMKEALNDLIDSMLKNQSLFSKAANYWHEIPLGQKIGLGVLLVAPAFFTGLLLHVAVLTTLSAVALCAYVVSDYLLKDHSANHFEHLAQLKKGIASLADLLSSMIELLELVNKQFAEELQKLKDNNIILSNQIGALESQVDLLHHQIKQMNATEQNLRQIQMDLEYESLCLKKENQEHSKCLKSTQAQLDAMLLTQDYNQLKLSEQLIALTESKTKIAHELERFQKCTPILQNTIKQLTGTLTMNKEQQTAFAQRVEQFIYDKEAPLEYLVGSITQSSNALSQTKNEYALSLERHQHLVSQYERLVKRYEAVVAKKEQEETPLKKETVKALTQFGLYSVDGLSSCQKLQPENHMNPAIKVH